MEEGDETFFFVQDLRLALVATLVPDDHRPSKSLRMAKLFRSTFFLTNRFQVLQDMSVESFTQTFEDLTA